MSARKSARCSPRTRGSTPSCTIRRLAANPPAYPLFRPGDLVGAFRIVEEVGRGGMGTVYRAERADGAFVQQVAVKVVRATIGDENSSRRFLAERQILASLNHPHIVRLLDGGVTPRGDAYLVMEYVDGLPITEYCVEAIAASSVRVWRCSVRSATPCSTRTPMPSSIAT